MRSVSKKRMEEHEMETQSVHSAALSDYGSAAHRDGPPPSSRPSFPTAASHPSLISAVPHASSHTHSNASPYATHLTPSAHVRRPDPDTATLLARPRRSRPEPYQLAALRKLFTRTQNPSIEERGALALEINMCVRGSLSISAKKLY